MSENEIDKYLDEKHKKEKAYIKIDSFPILAGKIIKIKQAKCPKCSKITKNIYVRDKNSRFNCIGKYCRYCKNVYIFSKRMRIFYALLENYNGKDLLSKNK